MTVTTDRPASSASFVDPPEEEAFSQSIRGSSLVKWKASIGAHQGIAHPAQALWHGKLFLSRHRDAVSGRQRRRAAEVLLEARGWTR